MEKVILKDLDYGKLGFLAEKMGAEMKAQGVMVSRIQEDYIVKAALVVLSNLTEEERKMVSAHWSSVLLKEVNESLNAEMGGLVARKDNLTYAIAHLSQEASIKEKKVRDLDEEYYKRKEAKEKELETSLQEKKDAVVLEAERLRNVRSELSKARRERNDYIRESEAIVRKANNEAEKLKKQTIEEAKEEAKAEIARLEGEALRSKEKADKILEAASRFRTELLKTEDENKRYIAIGSLLIGVFGSKVEEVAEWVSNAVQSAKVNVRIPTTFEMEMERLSKEMEEPSYKNFYSEGE